MDNAKHPLVSIIIPLFNSEKFIEQTINSALQQTYPNIEIIIIDDGSKDNSFEIANRYSSDKLEVIRQKNKGASAARNHGITVSKGEYIQFLDADDLLHPQKIASQVDTIKQYSDMHLIGAKWQRFDTDVNKPYKARPYTEDETRSFDKVEWLINRPYMVPNTWLVTKKLIDAAGLWDERLSFNDDGEFFYRVIAASEGVVINHNALVYYRFGNSSSLSQRRDKNAFISWIESIRSYKAIMHQYAGEKGNESVNRYFFELRYSCLNKFPDLHDICLKEMYNPDKIYNLNDTLVFKLTKYIGLSNAKKVRDNIKSVRESKMVKYLINKTKSVIGWKSY